MNASTPSTVLAPGLRAAPVNLALVLLLLVLLIGSGGSHLF
jgi:hypothetical protein